jgi:twitching motility protein PilT
MAEKTPILEEWLKIAIERDASDLHVIPGYYPTIRVNEMLYAVRTESTVTGEASMKILTEILNENQIKLFIEQRQYDFSYDMAGRRFRANYYFVKGSPAATFRIISPVIRTISELALPTIFYELAKLRSGLILITGPTGEGKTTTLAAMINEINQNEAKHIITIEDPIEYVYPLAKSIISQRELHSDTYSFSDALRGVLREDPDIVLIGEMRDLETTQAALTIAETGHLVLGTMHTSSTSEAINRILDIFPANQTGMVRSQLSSILRAVIAQRLIPSISAKGRTPAVEILINTPGVAAAIREGKTHLIDNMIVTGEEQGMLLFEKYLMRLYQQGQISKEAAYAYALRPSEISKFIT